MNSLPTPGSGLALVTGASGFVGNYLCAELLRQGWQVRGSVRSSAQLPAGAEAVAVGAIDGDTHWMGALCGVDVVIHLAARVHVMQEAAADPLAEFLKVNLHGTENLAQQAARAGVKRLVYVSSIGVSGRLTGQQQPFTEADSPNPHNAYTASKWQAEQALQRIAQQTGLQVVIVRPPLIYGPGAKGNFPQLWAAIDKGIPLPLAGARNLRSLVYVGNLADALIACATHPAAVGQTYLVRDGEDVSTALLAEKIAAALGCSNRSFSLPPAILRAAAAALGRTEQIDQLFGSLRVCDAKLRGELAWFPPYTLEQGLRVTADWYRSQHGRL